MAEAVSVGDIQLKESSGKGLCDYLREIKEEEDDEKIGHSRDILDLEQEKKKEIEDKLADKLLKALKNNDAFEVFALVENNHPIVSLNNVHQDCKDVADSECKDGKSRNYHCRLSSISNPFFCRFRGCRKNSTADEQQWEDDEQKNDEKKRKWIRILSNPLFISVEWLLKTKSTCQCEDCQRGKDVIEGALHDAYLLEKIASHEHYYDSDDYKRSVEAYETFAADVLEQSTSSELYEIMDIEGNGFLLQGKPQQLTNLNQSLRLLEIAAKKDRKKFVASPRCQFILNEIIYYKWPSWKDQSVTRKLLWMIVQLLLTTIITPFYILFRVFEKMHSKVCPSMSSDSMCPTKTSVQWVKNLYEHPYSKFVNHTMSNFVFLLLLFASSFDFTDDYKTSKTGLISIDYAVLIFVAGLSLREALAAYKQGIHFYFSRWWNVMHTLTLCTFLAAYTLWLSAWGIYGDWKPREDTFTVADVLYASAIVMAFLNFTYLFQVNKTLGPLQLSLYRMLKDVLKFLVIFLMLYVAFAAGVMKVYSYYNASQVKLREDGVIDHRGTHPYASFESTAIGLLWLLLGNADEDKIVVHDAGFTLISVFGRGFFIAYAVCTSIVALNMLIAMMNNSFERIMKDANMEWKFSWTRMWLDYIDEGNSIPVPFNLVYYSLLLFYIPLYLFCECCKKRKCSCYQTMNTGIEIELVKVDVGQDNGDQEQAREQCTAVKSDVLERSKADQTSASCCTCISSWCCFPYTCRYGPAKVDTVGMGETSAHFSCICSGCTCYCIPSKTSTVRKKRLQAMKFSVARYLNNMYVSGKTEGKTSTPTSSTNEGTLFLTSV